MQWNSSCKIERQYKVIIQKKRRKQYKDGIKYDYTILKILNMLDIRNATSEGVSYFSKNKI